MKDLGCKDKSNISKETYIFWGILALYFLMHLYNLNTPPNGYHQWRESDTAAISLNYYQEDLNFLEPRINQRGDSTGITGMEFPIFNYIIALLYFLFGPFHAIGQLLTILGGLLGLFNFYRFIKRFTTNTNVALSSMFLLAFSPLFFFYSFKIMPDIWMLSFLLTAIYYYYEYIEIGKRTDWILSAFFLTLSAVIKPPVLAVYSIFLLWSLMKTDNRKSNFLIFTGYFVLTFSLTLGWFLYARHVNELYQTGGFYLGETILDFPKYLSEALVYKKLFLQWPFELWLGWPVVPIFFIGLFNIIKDKIGKTLLVWIVSSYIVFFILSQHTRSHDYYTLIIVPPIILIAAIGLNKLFKNKYFFKTKFVLVATIIPILCFFRIHSRLADPIEFEPRRSAAFELIEQNDLVMIEDKTTAIRLYQINRKGWPLRSTISYDVVKPLVDRGGKYLILDNQLDKYDDSLFLIFEEKPMKINDLYCYRVKN